MARCSSVLQLIVLLLSLDAIYCRDVDHDDKEAPKQPGCDNKFSLVKIRYGLDGSAASDFAGVTARFGGSVPSRADQAESLALSLAQPEMFCTADGSKYSGDALLVERGNCTFTAKARNAQHAGASAVLIANTEEELFKMVCTDNGTYTDISIPTIMIPRSAGARLESLLAAGENVTVSLYSPSRPAVDGAEIFLWAIAVGTAVVGSLCSGCADDAKNSRYRRLNEPRREEKEVEAVEMNITAAALFMVFASVLLLLLYLFMSDWLLLLLVVVFCIGGVMGLEACLSSLLSWSFPALGARKINFPILGIVNCLSAALFPLCATFGILWAVFRNDISFAWVGQDILGVALILTVLVTMRLPNVKVATVLLSCAFVYDIFWVFLSPFLFNESVMVVIARGDKTGGEGIPMVLKFPRIYDPWGGFSILGFGDVILPGLLLAFTRRYDGDNKKGLIKGYFLPTTIAYGIGLVLTYIALNIMASGQPALLYIVPCVLGTVLALGWLRGELQALWKNVKTELTEAAA